MGVILQICAARRARQPAPTRAYGDDDPDDLSGGDGDDVLAGGLGADRLSGGRGDDVEEQGD